MRLSYETKLTFVLTVVSIAAGAAIAKYGDAVCSLIIDSVNQPASESSGLPSCPPHSVDVKSEVEMAHGPNVGLSPSGVICSFDR